MTHLTVVQIDGCDFGTAQSVMQHIVTSTSNGQDIVFLIDIQKLAFDGRILCSRQALKLSASPTKALTPRHVVNKVSAKSTHHNKIRAVYDKISKRNTIFIDKKRLAPKIVKKLNFWS